MIRADARQTTIPKRGSDGFARLAQESAHTTERFTRPELQIRKLTPIFAVDQHRNQSTRNAMKAENNKMVAVDYKLTVDGQIADRSQPGAPLEFIFGTGMLLPKFEEAVLGKEPGEKVSFTLAPADGYGEIIADAIVELPKTIFVVDGKPADEMLFVGNQIPMANAQGQHMVGVVKEVGAETVKMDFNHPMAGKTLHFDVEVVSVRDVTPEDLAAHGGCGSCHCGDDCGCDDHHHDACGCGGCH